MRSLHINLELNKDLRDANLLELAMDYGVTPEQIMEMGLIMFGHSLRYCEETPSHAVCFVHWTPCALPGCDCGKFVPIIEAAFALPHRKPAQGSSEGH